MRLLGDLLLYPLLAIAGLVGPAFAQVDSLPVIDNHLRRNFPEIESIKASELQALLKSKPGPMILDVREADEYAVSHLKGALRIDPDAELDDVLRQTGSNLKGAVIIVYCSVGVRSTELATRLRPGLRKNGAVRIANLSQGIFGWHNSKRPLVSNNEATPFVHPYNAVWGQLVDRKDLARYSTVGSAQTPAYRLKPVYIVVLFGALGLSAAANWFWRSRH
jgi:rhodanese-related sulfurtransferase